MSKRQTRGYFVIETGKYGRCFKVGITKVPKYRYQTIQTDNPRTLVMLTFKMLPALERFTEDWLKAFYAAYHLKGEWFILDGLIEKGIELPGEIIPEACQGDWKTLPYQSHTCDISRAPA